MEQSVITKATEMRWTRMTGAIALAALLLAGASATARAGDELPMPTPEIGTSLPVENCGTLDHAVNAALRDAQKDGRPGAVVLLSPACASFDQYPNFEVRGDAFVKAVTQLPGIEMTIPGDAHAART